MRHETEAKLIAFPLCALCEASLPGSDRHRCELCGEVVGPCCSQAHESYDGDRCLACLDYERGVVDTTYRRT